MTAAQQHFDSIVIGAGLIGMLSALELAEEGLRVAIVDKGEAARQASWAGGGILSPLPPWQYSPVVNALAAQSQLLYPQLCEQLEQQTRIDPQWWRCGMRVLSPDANAITWLQANKLNFTVEGRDLKLTDVAQLRTPRLGRAVRAAAILHPLVTLMENVPVSGLIVRAGRCEGVTLSSDKPVLAETIVVAAGAWSAELLPAGEWQPMIEPVRGQMLLFNPPETLLEEVLLSDKRYLIPRRDGRVLVGSTLENVGFDASTTVEAAEELRASAVTLLPTLADIPVEHHWAGLRPGSPEGIPSIGKHPEIANLFYNCGHFRNGVVLAPASAKLLATQVMGSSVSDVFAACLPSEQQREAA